MKAAHISGVRKPAARVAALESLVSGKSPAFAPASSSNRTVSRSPLAAPAMIGLIPASSRSEAPAPRSSSKRTVRELPARRAARISGVLPRSAVRTPTFAPAAMSNRAFS